jgi:hypothetical protein
VSTFSTKHSTVDRMTYLDENAPEHVLYDSTQVAISAPFIIYFTDAMHPERASAVRLWETGAP